MKRTVFYLIVAFFLTGCNSTSNTDDSTHSQSQTLTDSELQALANKTKFTAAELKAAADKLGFRCSHKPKTGSRIKKKVCTSEQQRLVREEARREFYNKNKLKLSEKTPFTVAPRG